MHNLLQVVEWSNQKFVRPTGLWAGYAPVIYSYDLTFLPRVIANELKWHKVFFFQLPHGQVRKNRRNYWKKRLNISNSAKFESDSS